MKVLVAGLLNLETSVPVEGFPLAYRPTGFVEGVRSVPSGVGWNVALAMHTLGSDVTLVGFRAPDPAGRLIERVVAESGIDAVLFPMPRSPQSVILIEEGGRRAIYADLADVQECRVPDGSVDRLLAGRDLAVLANVDWTRHLLGPARDRGIPIATDLHDVASLENPYDTDYLEHADVIFFSDERLPSPPEEVAAAWHLRYGVDTIAVGLGRRGALLSRRGHPPIRFPAVDLRPVRSTTGAGDALFAAFCHFRFSRGWPPGPSLEAAVAFASWKVGAQGGSEGFLDEAALTRLLGGDTP